MGQLVFQATAGGQVALVGPNPATNFSINVPAITGTLVTTGDTGTVTSTMLASSVYTAPGTIGSVTPNTGAFTTLSASSTVSGTGFSTYLASPPAIGGTTADAGSFTTLSGSTSVTTPIVKSASSLTLQTNGTTTAITIDTSQRLLVGVTSAINSCAFGFQSDNYNTNGMVLKNTSSTYNSTFMYFVNSGGNGAGSIVQTASTTVNYGTSSDYRLKENVAPMTGALTTVAQLKPVTYDWIFDKTKGQGFIAHELQAIVPDCVTGEKDAVDSEGNPIYQNIDTSFLVATLTAAIQELNAKVDAQAAEILLLQPKTGA